MIASALFFFWWVGLTPHARVHGSVHDAQNGEALARVSVRLLKPDIRAETETNSSGNFDITGVAPGSYSVVVSCVGYRLFQERIQLKADDSRSIDVVLSPEALEHKDTVEVHADAFDLETASGPTAFTLTGTEAKNLAGVLADDPMRALQSAPGVAANDDFESRFTLHGAAYEQLGLYLDGILLHRPFHTVQGEGPSGSIAVFNGDMVADMTVQSEGYGAQFENRTAGAISIRTREGSTDGMHFRFSVGAPDAGLLGEGPLGKKHKGSWLISVRKSYLQYFLKDLPDDVGSLAFGFMDVQAQFNYRLSDTQSFSLSLLDGTSDLNRSSAKSSLGLNAAEIARYHYSLVGFAWQLTPSQSFLLKTTAAFTRERYDNTNISEQPLGFGYYGEWVVKSDATWSWSDTAQFQFGAVARPQHASGFANYYTGESSVIQTNWYGGNAINAGGYMQQKFSLLSRRLSISIGGRWDTLTVDQRAVLSPQASVAYTPWAGGTFSLAWGHYVQFPEISSLYAENGSPHLQPALAQHLTSAFEQRIGEHMRFRVETFERNDRNLLFQPFMDARYSAGEIIPDNFQTPILNTLRGRTKGAEVLLQRRSANGFTGWVSYTFSESEMHDTLTGIRFPSDLDQRHTINSYLSYRLRPSVNLSSKFTWGSGFPVPGFFSLRDGTYYLGSVLNEVRLPPYERLDVRLNKSKTLRRGKLSVFVEAINVLNHANYRFDSYNGYDPATRQAYVSSSQMFPILPSAGMTYEF